MNIHKIAWLKICEHPINLQQRISHTNCNKYKRMVPSIPEIPHLQQRIVHWMVSMTKKLSVSNDMLRYFTTSLWINRMFIPAKTNCLNEGQNEFHLFDVLHEMQAYSLYKIRLCCMNRNWWWQWYLQLKDGSMFNAERLISLNKMWVKCVLFHHLPYG